MNNRSTKYLNTPENAVHVGWVHCPEHCFGDSTLPYVVHDYVAGTFTYSE